MPNPVEALSPVRPSGQSPARAEARPYGQAARKLPTPQAEPAQPTHESLGRHLDVLA